MTKLVSLLLLVLLICATDRFVVSKPMTKLPTGSTNQKTAPDALKIPSSGKRKWELDTSAMIKKNPFKIPPAKLIERAKVVIDGAIGLKNPDDLAEDFVFQFPIVGPLSKAEYLAAVGGFDLGGAFPDFDQGLYYDFRVDPYKPSRVWFTGAFQAQFSGDKSVFGKGNGKLVTCPPQAVSLTFNEEGKVIKYTGGYVMDKEVGNSGGLGGVFGLAYAVGKGLPFPEAQPYSPSIQYRLFNLVSSLALKLAPKPKKEEA